MEPDFKLLARAFNRAHGLHRFDLTAWVFLPDPSAEGQCTFAPRYPEMISQRDGNRTFPGFSRKGRANGTRLDDGQRSAL